RCSAAIVMLIYIPGAHSAPESQGKNGGQIKVGKAILLLALKNIIWGVTRCFLNSMPKCLFSDVTCEPPPEIAGGKVQGVKKPRYLPGETAHYQCWQGFQMTGASTVTCQNGTWTERPQCKGNCRLSETAMARNNIKLRWSSKRSNIYRSKETISFKCYFLFREVSNPEDFEAQCQDGVINYPRCESQLEK
uniref:Sushi domain-containing protein n=1 Tax=Anas zonorhyncha TaxID=75864 RepID=A0A8B9UJM9_9AVES